MMGLSLKMEAGPFQRRADMGDLKKGNITYANARPSAPLLLQGRPQVQLDFSSLEGPGIN
jgi:hypothetical protein